MLFETFLAILYTWFVLTGAIKVEVSNDTGAILVAIIGLTWVVALSLGAIRSKLDEISRKLK